MSKNIRSYKLVTGEEIIGTDHTFSDNMISDTNIFLKNVRMLALQQTGPGQFGVIMVPWMRSDRDGVIKNSKEHIVGELVDDIPKHIEHSYIHETSGIQIADANDINLR